MKQLSLFYISCIFLFLGLSVPLMAEIYPEVLFENSVLPNSYSNSKVEYEGTSWIRNLKKSLPTSDSVYYTPGNSLVLNYISAENGHWQTDIAYPESYIAPNNAVLIFKLYIQSSTNVEELPVIQLIQTDSTRSEKVYISEFLSNFQEDMWLSIEIPLKRIRGFKDNIGISGIRFLQQAKDGKEHSLYIDQIEILPQKTPQNKLTGAAVIQSVQPFEHHVNIMWRLPLTPSIRYIKIYRSENNKDFEPVAIRPVFATRYTDVIDEVGKLYYYKIAWVDYEYRESPFSEVKEVKTKVFTNKELLDMVQQANIQYFIDAAEFNSGMQRLKMGSKDAVVSSQLSGLGIMALISGAEQKLFSREILIARIQKIVNFLEKAESIHGAYPSLMDGRTGKGVFIDPSIRNVDLQGTSYLIQGLLVAKQYLNHDNSIEAAIRNKITAIWNAVEWNYFVKDDFYLYTNWSPETEFEKAVPLLGRDALSTYLIALASPLHNIELESYHQALTKSYVEEVPIIQDMEELELTRDSLGVVQIEEPLVLDDLMNVQTIDNKVEKNYYGLSLALSNPDYLLSRFLAAFLVFDPRDKRDEFANYFNELQQLVLIQHRKSLEESLMPVSLAHNLTINSKGWVDPSSNVASYPFQPDLSLRNLTSIYREYPTLFWSEYGFRAVQFEKNKVHASLEGMQRGIAAVMIENGKSGLIWDLFSKDKDISKIVNVLFEPETKQDK